MTRFDRGQRISAGLVEADRVSIDLDRHDPTTQTVASSHVYITAEGVRMYPVNLRYAWPAELDLMAQLAGMKLRRRWSDWRRNPFTSASTSHVSVYELEQRPLSLAATRPGLECERYKWGQENDSA